VQNSRKLGFVYAKTDEAASSCVSAVQAGAQQKPPVSPRQAAVPGLLPRHLPQPRAGVNADMQANLAAAWMLLVICAMVLLGLAVILARSLFQRRP
jgi:phosphate/sulfate permease